MTWPYAPNSVLSILHEDYANARWMMRAVLRVAVLAAAAICVLADKGDLYGKDGKEKNSVVEVLTLTLGQMRGMLYGRSLPRYKSHAAHPAAAPALAMRRA